MTMPAKGLPKLIEECGELTAVAGKKLAYYTTDEHPDGAGALSTRLEKEMGDVIASIYFVAQQLNLSVDKIDKRAAKKLSRYCAWESEPGNAPHAVDANSHPPIPFL